MSESCQPSSNPLELIRNALFLNGSPDKAWVSTTVLALAVQHSKAEDPKANSNYEVGISYLNTDNIGMGNPAKFISTKTLVTGDTEFVSQIKSLFSFEEGIIAMSSQFLECLNASMPQEHGIYIVGYNIEHSLGVLAELNFQFTAPILGIIGIGQLRKEVHNHLTDSPSSIPTEPDLSTPGVNCARNVANFSLRAAVLLAADSEQNPDFLPVKVLRDVAMHPPPTGPQTEAGHTGGDTAETRAEANDTDEDEKYFTDEGSRKSGSTEYFSDECAVRERELAKKKAAETADEKGKEKGQGGE
ncbi:hypothetical protein OQA88_312 [Cercophora sp. LCS_1]